MKKISALIIALVMMAGYQARADEGMWLLSLIGKNYDEMKAMGFRLSPEDIYSVNNASMKDAIVGLGKEGSPLRHFCTAEIVSDEGLLFTNHHCGYGYIQEHSTVEHDYLKDGFWAMSKDEELANEGLTASILDHMKDVTAEVLANVTEDMSNEERQKAIDEASEEIIKGTEKGQLKAQVIDMFDNNQYFLFVYTIYKDVRLVGAPPSDMGKFGGDTDNWMWPRHTADFSMFRIYTAPDGSPAIFDEKNIPLKPKYSLPVSLEGVEDNDFAMVMGFPGGTDRYITSYGLKEAMEITNAHRYKIRTVKLDVLREDMAADPKVNIQYATKYAHCSNYWKYSNEQNKALRQLGTMQQKQKLEKKYQAWADNQRTDKYRNVLSKIDSAYSARRQDKYVRVYLIESLLSGADLPLFAFRFRSLYANLENNNDESIQEFLAAKKEEAKEFYKDYNPATEQKLLSALFKTYYDNVDAAYYPEEFAPLAEKNEGDFTEWAEKIMDKSIFATQARMMEFLEKPKAKTLEKDPMYAMAQSIISSYFEISGKIRKYSTIIEENRRLFTQGLMEMSQGNLSYPDSNSTIRLTYGKVAGYKPRDAVRYKYYTTMKGVIEKEDPDDMEFDIPKRLKKLYEEREFGRYANAKGQLNTCFLTDNDITGGNSGSPVINGDGALIGIAFDGNSEAMSGDIEFEDNLQRCINLDIRYALWIIDVYANAGHLIKEMDIRE